MQAKAKITREMIVDTAFAVAREAGVENINAGASEGLHCSAQPIVYHFSTVEELKGKPAMICTKMLTDRP